jgi:transcription initiation factor TFIIB
LTTRSRDLQPNRADVGVALRELNRFCEKLSVPDAVKDEAARICMRGLERGLEKGRSLAQISASSLYAACREKGVPAPLDDVAAASEVDRKAVARCYRLLVRELDMEIPIVDPAGYFATLASRAGVTAEVQARSLEILQRVEEVGGTAGTDPLGLAASVLYLAAALEGQKLTQEGAAEAAGVTEVTIRNQLKRLRKIL